MATKRIGELLSQIVPLSGHDIEEVLHEQSTATRGRARKSFGDIALALGLCRPEHVWKAWCGQLEESQRYIDLDEFGVDAQALAFISAETARRESAVPMRVFGDMLILATDRAQAPAGEISELARRIGKQVRFVLTEPAALRRAIEVYYPPLQAAG